MGINYSNELKSFIKAVAKEVAEDRVDGILGKLSKVTGGEREVYELIVGEGFNITYTEFLGYYKSCQAGVIAAASGELSDDDLDNVAGGFGFDDAVNAAKKAANAAAKAAQNANNYVANNPEAIIGGSSALGGGLGTALGAGTGAIIGGTIGGLFAGSLIIPGAGLGVAAGGAIGGGVGTATGTIVGIGTVLVANELSD